MKKIEARDLRTEYQVMAYAVYEDPSLLSVISPLWFTSRPLIKLIKIGKNKKQLHPDNIAVATSQSIAQKLVRAHVLKNRDQWRMAADELLKLSNKRELLAMAQEVHELASSDQIDDAITRYKKLVEAKGTGIESHNWAARGSVRIKDQREARASGHSTLIKSGLLGFDKSCGGMAAGEFGIIVGKSGLGKTAFLVHIAASAYELGHNVVFVSAEMPAVQIEHRFDGRLANVNLTSLRLNRQTKQEFQEWTENMQTFQGRQNYLEISELPDDPTMQDVFDVVSNVEAKHGKPADMIVLDYLNLISGDDTKDDWKSQKKASWQIKDYCKRRMTRLWTAGQVTDENYTSKWPSLSQIKYARAIAENTPIVLFLHQTKEDEVEDRIGLHVLKARNSAKPETPLYYYPEFSRMRLTDEES